MKSRLNDALNETKTYRLFGEAKSLQNNRVIQRRFVYLLKYSIDSNGMDVLCICSNEAKYYFRLFAFLTFFRPEFLFKQYNY